MDRLFRIDFYPQDWLIDTARLTPEERGIYIQVVCLIYANRGPIINDYSWISGVSGTSKTITKNIVKKLISKNFLQEKDGKIGQKRAENEIKSKRNHLENSAKGGRNSRGPGNKNKGLETSDTSEPLPSPSPSPKATAKETPPLSPQGGNGVFHSENGKEKDFRIDDHLTDDARLHARKKAPGWDQQHLMKVYDEGIKDGKRARPVHPNAAFPVWCGKYTEGKKP